MPIRFHLLGERDDPANVVAGYRAQCVQPGDSRRVLGVGVHTMGFQDLGTAGAIGSFVPNQQLHRWREDFHLSRRIGVRAPLEGCGIVRHRLLPEGDLGEGIRHGTVEIRQAGGDGFVIGGLLQSLLK